MANKKRHMWLKYVRNSAYSVEQLLHWPKEQFLSKSRSPKGEYVLDFAERTRCIGISCTPLTACVGGEVVVVNYFGRVLFNAFLLPRYMSLDWQIACRRRDNAAAGGGDNIGRTGHRRVVKCLTLEEARPALRLLFTASVILGFDAFGAMRSLGFHMQFHAVDVRRLPIFGCVADRSARGLMEHFYEIDIRTACYGSVVDYARAAVVLFRTFEAEFGEFFLLKHERDEEEEPEFTRLPAPDDAVD